MALLYDLHFTLSPFFVVFVHFWSLVFFGNLRGLCAFYACLLLFLMGLLGVKVDIMGILMSLH